MGILDLLAEIRVPIHDLVLVSWSSVYLALDNKGAWTKHPCYGHINLSLATGLLRTCKVVYKRQQDRALPASINQKPKIITVVNLDS